MRAELAENVGVLKAVRRQRDQAEQLLAEARKELLDLRRGSAYWRARAEKAEEALKELGWASD